MVDLTTYTDADLDTLAHQVAAEQERRRIPKVMDTLNSQYLNIEGTTQNQDWRQPTGAFDAYPKGWQVTYNAKTWESLVPANVWAPGTANWREVTPPSAAPPDWVQPTGAGDAYNTGDQVTFNGQVYESTIDANVWSPTGYPQGWKLITPTA